MSAHRILHDLYRAPKRMADPGNAGRINVSQDLQILEMVSAASESRTLANPTKAGIRFALRLFTDGGDVAVTAAAGLNVTGNTIATFEDASDMLCLISVSTSSGYRWEIEVNVGAVALS